MEIHEKALKMKILDRHKNSLKSLFAFLLCVGVGACGYLNWPGQMPSKNKKSLEAYERYSLLGAVRLLSADDGQESRGEWQRFSVESYVDREGQVHFGQRVAVARGQYLALDYRYRLKGNSAHTLQGSVSFYNEKNEEVAFELMLRLEFKDKKVAGYAKSVANLQVEAWEGVAMVNSLGTQPLLDVEFGEKGGTAFFQAPFSYMRYGTDQSGATDFAVAHESKNLLQRANGMRLHYRLAQSSQSKLQIKSWHWLEPQV